MLAEVWFVSNVNRHPSGEHEVGAEETGPVLTPAATGLFLFLFFGLFAPLTYWLGWNQPSLFDIRGEGYPQPWAEFLTVLTVSALFMVPFVWMAVGRVIDPLALTLGLNALILVGYFFLDRTGARIEGAERPVLDAANMILAINAIGFFTLLAVLVGWYAIFSVGQRQIRPLPAPPEVMDNRFRWFVYPFILAVTAMVALPMVLTGTVPMLSPNPVEGRLALLESNVGRPLYNLASSLLPAAVASCLILAWRRRGVWKIFNMEVVLVGLAVAVQLLTSNRTPLAMSMMMTFALFTFEWKFPRWLMPLMVAAYFAAFLGLGGFSSIVRQNRDLLDEGNIVAASFTEAFMGDNLSDLRDGAWVMGEWNMEPLNGKTYLGGLAALFPSAIFPQKKEWYLGWIGLKIVQWPTEEHFGLRMSFFAESFLNFGLAGTIGLAVFLGSYYGYLLKALHLAARSERQCLTRNIRLMLALQLGQTFSNSSEGFVFYSLVTLLVLIWIVVDFPLRSQYAPHRS